MTYGVNSMMTTRGKSVRNSVHDKTFIGQTWTSLYNVLVNIFSRNNLPWNNMCSVLMYRYSCAVMGGSKSGLGNKDLRQLGQPSLGY